MSRDSWDALLRPKRHPSIIRFSGRPTAPNNGCDRRNPICQTILGTPYHAQKGAHLSYDSRGALLRPVMVVTDGTPSVTRFLGRLNTAKKAPIYHTILGAPYYAQQYTILGTPYYAQKCAHLSCDSRDSLLRPTMAVTDGTQSVTRFLEHASTTLRYACEHARATMTHACEHTRTIL